MLVKLPETYIHVEILMKWHSWSL